MKTLSTLKTIALATLVIGTQAFAAQKIVGAQIVPDGQNKMLKINAEVCKSGFPTISTDVIKVSSDTAVVTVALGQRVCANTGLMEFTTTELNAELTDLGLDPQTARIFVQLQ